MQAPALATGARRTGVPAQARHPRADRAGFRISVGTAHAYVHAVTALLAPCAPGLTQALREADPEYVLVDGTLAECDRVCDGRADYSGKHRRHGVNLQVIAGPEGKLVWAHERWRAAPTT